jgi:hypothetical protein
MRTLYVVATITLMLALGNPMSGLSAQCPRGTTLIEGRQFEHCMPPKPRCSPGFHALPDSGAVSASGVGWAWSCSRDPECPKGTEAGASLNGIFCFGTLALKCESIRGQKACEVAPDCRWESAGSRYPAEGWCKTGSGRDCPVGTVESPDEACAASSCTPADRKSCERLRGWEWLTYSDMTAHCCRR